MHTSPIHLATLLAAALCVTACSSGAPDSAPDPAPEPAPAVAPEDVASTERSTAPEAAVSTAPLRYMALREGRAYEGAPPVIAHPIGLGTECSECHLDGSEGFDDPELPPPTPHPELENCRMCHVFVNASDTFGDNDYQPVRYLTRQQVHDLSPPLIPHPLTMRERCVVCHNHGETASARWQTDLVPLHSESWNCRMCHVPASMDLPGPRPGATPLPLGEE